MQVRHGKFDRAQDYRYAVFALQLLAHHIAVSPMLTEPIRRLVLMRRQPTRPTRRLIWMPNPRRRSLRTVLRLQPNSRLRRFAPPSPAMPT